MGAAEDLNYRFSSWLKKPVPAWFRPAAILLFSALFGYTLSVAVVTDPRWNVKPAAPSSSAVHEVSWPPQRTDSGVVQWFLVSPTQTPLYATPVPFAATGELVWIGPAPLLDARAIVDVNMSPVEGTEQFVIVANMSASAQAALAAAKAATADGSIWLVVFTEGHRPVMFQLHSGTGFLLVGYFNSRDDGDGLYRKFKAVAVNQPDINHCP